MGSKDIVEKQLEDYNDVFSDILIVLLFDSKTLLKYHKSYSTLFFLRQNDIIKYLWDFVTSRTLVPRFLNNWTECLPAYPDRTYLKASA